MVQYFYTKSSQAFEKLPFCKGLAPFPAHNLGYAKVSTF